MVCVTQDSSPDSRGTVFIFDLQDLKWVLVTAFKMLTNVNCYYYYFDNDLIMLVKYDDRSEVVTGASFAHSYALLCNRDDLLMRIRDLGLTVIWMSPGTRLMRACWASTRL